MPRPLILVTADRREPDGFHTSPRVRPKRPEAYVLEAYVDAVRRCGGTPLVLPPGPADLASLLPRVDGVVLTGGDMDIHPSHYGEAVEGRIDRIEPSRTELELDVARYCLDHGVPVLGVCGGMQVLAVAAGGSLIQDLPAPTSMGIFHEQPNDPATPSHPVLVQGRAVAWLGETLSVNSTHHQAVKSPGAFEITGRAPDDVVEVIVHPTHPYAVGVQWHPELLGQFGVYAALIQAAIAH